VEVEHPLRAHRRDEGGQFVCRETGREADALDARVAPAQVQAVDERPELVEPHVAGGREQSGTGAQQRDVGVEARQHGLARRAHGVLEPRPLLGSRRLADEVRRDGRRQQADDQDQVRYRLSPERGTQPGSTGRVQHAICLQG
jgi:hypothetical protein